MAKQERKRSSGSQSVGKPVRQPYTVYVFCPLNCFTIIPKNKVEQHVHKECVKRVFICKHCNFKATYEEVVGTHSTECPILTQQCPYLCGTSLLPDAMQGHLKLCPLREVACEFSLVGCDQMIKQHEQEEHNRRSIQKHIQLLAEATVGACQQLHCISCELDRRLVDLEEKEAKVERKQTGQHQLVLQEMKAVRDCEEQMKLNQKKQEARLEVIHQQWELSKHLEERLTEHLDTQNKKNLEEIEASLRKCNDQQQQQKKHFCHLQENLKKMESQYKQYLKEMEANMKKYTDQQQQLRDSLQLLQKRKDFKEIDNTLKQYIDQQQEKQFLQLEQRMKLHLDQKFETTKKHATMKTPTSDKQDEKTSSTPVLEQFKQQMEANLKEYIDQQQQIQFQQLEKRLKQQLDKKFEAEEKNATRTSSASDTSYEKNKKTASSPLHQFVIQNFKLQLDRSEGWKSPLMYTHHHGYKFLVEIDLSKCLTSGERTLDVKFVLHKGKYNDILKWPVHIDFKWELYNDRGKKLYSSIFSRDWNKYLLSYRRPSFFCSQHAVPICKLLPHVCNDKIYFNITSIKII